jgi:hypothetical protein
MIARESEERHRGHAGGTENHAEYVEVHLSARGSRGSLFSKAPMQENPGTQNSYGDSVRTVSGAARFH